MAFIDRLSRIQRSQNSLLCVGLDTDLKFIPPIRGSASNLQYEFNRRIVDATSDLVCAYKINISFYESAGLKGWEAIQKTVAYIPKHLLIVGDGKRGDIGNSSDHQARALREGWKFGASTVNPYMGEDSVSPFLDDPDHGVFILALTSNRGSRDFQYLKSSGRPLYEHVVARAMRWDKHNNVGLVVGATHPADLKKIRSLAPEMPFLIPGIGAQQGDLAATVRYGCTKEGNLALINAGRSVIYVSSNRNFAQLARKEALRLRDEINILREKFFQSV